MNAGEFGRAFVRVRRPGPVLVVWRWRYEVGAVVAAVAGAQQIGPQWTLLFGAFVVGALSTPYGRRRLWVVVVQHRVRTGLKHGWVQSRTGRLPMVLWTRPVPEGEQVLLLLRPGTGVGDVEAADLAAACWAREVWVEPDPERAQIIRLTVVRYDAPA
jgi:hypothetical protein